MRVAAEGETVGPHPACPAIVARMDRLLGVQS